MGDGLRREVADAQTPTLLYAAMARSLRHTA